MAKFHICNLPSSGSIKGRIKNNLSNMHSSVRVIYIYKCWLTRAIYVSLDYIFSFEGCADDIAKYIKACIDTDNLYNIKLLHGDKLSHNLHLLIRVNNKETYYNWIPIETAVKLPYDVKKAIIYECESTLYKFIHNITCAIV